MDGRRVSPILTPSANLTLNLTAMKLLFEFADSEQQAQAICERVTKTQSRYMNKKHHAKVTPWTSQDGKEHKFVVWYHV